MKNKIKIVFIVDSLGRGGAQRQMVELARTIDRNLFEPLVLIYFDIQQLRKDLDDAKIPIFLIKKKSKYDLLFLFKLISFLQQHNPDVVLSYLNTANFWARISGWMAGVKVIISSERSGDVGESKIRILLEMLLQKVTTLTVSNSEYVRNVLVEKVGVDPRKLRVVFNGVDINRLNDVNNARISDLRLKVGLDESHYIIALVGRIAPEKNHKCLIRAMSRLVPLDAKVKVLFFGNEHDLDLKKELIGEILRYDLGEHFIFCGPQEDMAAVYAMSDVVVLPSLWESFPNVVVEAMATGTPVVVSDVSDNSKIISDGKSGYIFRRDDDVALAECLVKLMNLNPDEVALIADSARNSVSKNYSLNVMTESFQKLIISKYFDLSE